MLGHAAGVIFKFSPLAAVSTIASFEVLQSWAQAIILASAVVLALGIIWTKVLKPLGAFFGWVRVTFGHLEQIPNIVTRLEVIEGAMYGTGTGPLPIKRRDDPPNR